eukprot:1539258-Heterocapsa_arctica.AAC.1
MCEKLFAILGKRHRDSPDPLACSYKARVDYAHYNIIAHNAQHVIKHQNFSVEESDTEKFQDKVDTPSRYWGGAQSALDPALMRALAILGRSAVCTRSGVDE